MPFDRFPACQIRARYATIRVEGEKVSTHEKTAKTQGAAAAAR
jgi:hypothetical protein